MFLKYVCYLVKEKERNIFLSFSLVRLIGLEPTRIATPDPKSGASTNFATSAIVFCKRSAKIILLFDLWLMIDYLFCFGSLFCLFGQ